MTLQEQFESGLSHHQAGRLAEAESLYRQVLAQQPDHVGALHRLGVVSGQMGRNEIAVVLIRRAIALSPNFPQAHGDLGIALKDKGQFDEAIAAFRRAIALNPNFPQAYSNLGIALVDKGQLDEAISAFRQAIALSPNYPEAHYNLGSALVDKGELDEAISAFRRAIDLRPGFAQAHGILGIALKDKGMLDEAIGAYRQAIALRPDYAEAHNNLGIALKDKGQVDEAIAAYRQAIALMPQLPEAHNNLGIALNAKGQLDEAVAAYHQALALRPNYPEAHYNLGNALKDNGQLEEAIAAHRQALAFRPDYAEAYNNLGNILKDNGQVDEAIAAYRHAIALNPQFPIAHGNLIFAQHYHPGYDAQAIAEEQRRWNDRYAEPLRRVIQRHTNDRDPNRRLRIGYVSPDFRDHAVGQNLLPLFQQHDRRQFEIICYSHAVCPDKITSRLQRNVDDWRDIVGLSDEQAAEQIRQDRIDILVDLALHTGQNRLLIFARKPAPVQVCYLGYCGSTGMSAMDYRLSDPHLDPPETDLSCYSEKTLRLPRSYWCYQPGASPELSASPSPSPALNNGFVTFGCLNNFAKVSPGTFDLWAGILAVVPNSNLILHAHPGKYLEDVVRRLECAGVAKTRLKFVGVQPRMKYLQTYSQIDIGLDPFPYGGGITTCDALWMGVPVVSLSGQTAVGRGGRSILSNLGLTELIALRPDQYVHIAVELAKDKDRMDSLRRGMRARMLASPLMDAEGFARDMEGAYRQMWRAWCAEGGKSGLQSSAV